MSIWEGAEDCPICGAEPPVAETMAYGMTADSFWERHTHSEDVAVSRDGARGGDLVPLFVEDAYAILERDIPSDVQADIRTYRASYVLNPEPMPSDDALGEATDRLHDLTMYALESDLSDAGYVTDWEDGYVIYDARPYREGT